MVQTYVRHAPLARVAMAYVLAGGRGSRLMELTDIRAKPAVYFGGKSRIIDFALSNALNSGIRRMAVATQYKAHSLIRHMQRGWNFFRPERNELAAEIAAEPVGRSHLQDGLRADAATARGARRRCDRRLPSGAASGRSRLWGHARRLERPYLVIP